MALVVTSFAGCSLGGEDNNGKTDRKETIAFLSEEQEETGFFINSGLESSDEYPPNSIIFLEHVKIVKYIPLPEFHQ